MILKLRADDETSATNTALASELVEVIHLEQDLDASRKGTEETLKKTSSLRNASKEKQAVLQKYIDTVLSNMSWDNRKPIYISAYAKTYTAQELREAINFFKSPAGQKWVLKEPQAIKFVIDQTRFKNVAAADQMRESLKNLNNIQTSSNSPVVHESPAINPPQ